MLLHTYTKNGVTNCNKNLHFLKFFWCTQSKSFVGKFHKTEPDKTTFVQGTATVCNYLESCHTTTYPLEWPLVLFSKNLIILTSPRPASLTALITSRSEVHYFHQEEQHHQYIATETLLILCSVHRLKPPKPKQQLTFNTLPKTDME